MKEKSFKAFTLYFAIFIAILFLLYAFFSPQPIFESKVGEYTFYLYSKSSNCTIVSAQAKDAKTVKKNLKEIKGESLFLPFDQLEKNYGEYIENIVQNKKAQLMFEEQGEWGKGYYFYSAQLSNGVVISGKKINLHIVVSNKGITVGSPMIFGSF